MGRKVTIAITSLIWFSGCMSYFEASSEIQEKCQRTDLYAIQVQDLALQVWDCSGQEIGGKVVDYSIEKR